MGINRMYNKEKEKGVLNIISLTFNGGLEEGIIIKGINTDNNIYEVSITPRSTYSFENFNFDEGHFFIYCDSIFFEINVTLFQKDYLTPTKPLLEYCNLIPSLVYGVIYGLVEVNLGKYFPVN